MRFTAVDLSPPYSTSIFRPRASPRPAALLFGAEVHGISCRGSNDKVSSSFSVTSVRTSGELDARIELYRRRHRRRRRIYKILQMLANIRGAKCSYETQTKVFSLQKFSFYTGELFNVKEIALLRTPGFWRAPIDITSGERRQYQKSIFVIYRQHSCVDYGFCRKFILAVPPRRKNR